MAGTIITLDYDGENIKLLAVHGKRVGKWASAPLDPDIIRDGSIISPQLLSGKIESLMKSSGIIGNRIITSLSGLYTTNFTIDIPKQSKGSNWDIIQDTISGVMPDANTNPYWKVLTSNQDMDRILVIGIPKDILNNHIKTLRAMHLKPVALELKGMALARAVNRKQALIINTEPYSYDIVIVMDGVPYVMHTRAQSKFSSTSEQANILSRSLEQAIIYYNSHYQETIDIEDTPLFIVGQFAEDPNLKKELQDILPYHIDEFTPPLEFPPYLPVSRYAVNLGLALRSTKPVKGKMLSASGIDINLRHRTNIKEKLTPKKLIPYVAVSLGIALVFTMFNMASDAITETEELRYDLNGYQMQIDIRREELNQLAVDKTKVQEYDMLVAERGFYLDIMKLLDEITPTGVKIIGLNLTKTNITIAGTANTYDQLSFKNALENSGVFNKVELPTASTEGGNFGIKATIKKN